MPASVCSLICVPDRVREQGPAASGDVSVVVWQVLDTLADPRRARGRRPALATVLALGWGAVRAGARWLVALGDGAANLPRWSRGRWRISRRPPAASTIRRVLVAVDADVLDAVWHAGLAALEPRASAEPDVPPEVGRAVVVDGKTAGGAVGSAGRRAALLSMVDQASGVPLGQVQSTATGEIASCAPVVDRIDTRGVVVTADAVPTQQAHAHSLHRPGGHYLFIVQANQPSRPTRRRALAWARGPVGHLAHGKGHRRRERRTLQVISAASPRLPFPHPRQALRISREPVEISTGRISREGVDRSPT